MKLKNLIIATIITTTLFTACKKKDNSTPVTTSMTATINGSPFSGSLAIFAVNSGTLEIDGGNQNTQNTLALQLLDPCFRLYISDYTIGSIGTYSFAGATSTASGEIDSNSAMATYVVGSTGTISITKSTSSAITGTFNFVCTDGTTVTGGTFTAKAN